MEICKIRNYSSKIKTCSMGNSKTIEISCASFKEGLYLFFSRNTIVSRRTPTFCASSSCDKLNLALSSLILLFIFQTIKFYCNPAHKKDEGHAQNSGTNQRVRFHFGFVADIHQKKPQINGNVIGK